MALASRGAPRARGAGRVTNRIKGLPPGEYCFEVSANGWDPIDGLLEVSGKHPKAAKVELSLPLAQ